MATWEYKSVSINVVGGHIHNTEEEQKMLNELGAAGWELLSVTPITAEGKTSCLVHHFSRSNET